ncbi:MAG: bifunctional phosphopantothenoylcysteine decarboxylase/phosphopantothenate--cysteine ligase CoaBC [Bacteroidales bacterium]|jgi:phosphopantothenoylcysteine decarboxylase/phosphopantothenate--cysteine ligase|nr:bifunctional phosphopantothenoylcysteine decarboxylase/phosphopantothenate--cysteine ligase CoaBC [Bacteroidales bacterium]
MSISLDKNIVIGITGGIAVYKSLSLIRLFKIAHCEVKVVATRNALKFITPLTIETLSQNVLYTDTFQRSEAFSVNHIAHSDWASAVIVAPATANIIGKMANGIADDALSTLLMACRKPIFIAPAMNNAMYEHPALQQNIETLVRRGIHLIKPATGFLACNAEGKGRMEEPERIFENVASYFLAPRPLQGRHALVSAGPTHEPIDPVRFIGNHSSGLMGFALAQKLAEAGAEVTLVSGPVSLSTPENGNITRIDVTTAAQMHKACRQYAARADIIVMAAAVADYTPETAEQEKIKKNTDNWQLSLTKTTDILRELGKQKTDHQIIMGFALETENEIEHAKAKLQSKNADFIVLNSLKEAGAGFIAATNKVTVFTREGAIIEIPLKSKTEIAYDLVQLICERCNCAKN